MSGTLGPGDRFGPYEILSCIAVNLGEVYVARDPRQGRDIVLKLFPADLEQIKGEFQSEERAAKILNNHPNMVAVYEAGTWNRRHFIAMELLEGRTLREHLGGGPLNVAAAEKYAMEIALVLAFAHERGVVHGELKPANVFITVEDRIKVFGFRDKTGTKASFRAVVFSPGYMAPEQIRGEEWDQRADIFAFGAILYEMLSGVCPFQGASAVEACSATLQSTPLSLRQQNPQVPERLELLVRRCLAKNRAERFQSGQDLALELERLSARG